MNNSEVAELEAKLSLKLPIAYVELIRAARQEFVAWPPGTDLYQDWMLTDTRKLLEVNLKVRERPGDYLEAAGTEAKWPANMFVYGYVSDEGAFLHLYLLDCNEQIPLRRFISHDRKKIQDWIYPQTLPEAFGESARAYKRKIQEAKKLARQAAAIPKQQTPQKNQGKPSPRVDAPDLLEVGESMARPAALLTDSGKTYAGIWRGAGVVPAPRGEWSHVISLACGALPVNPRMLKGVISVYQSEEDNGPVVRHDPSATLPKKTDGTKLFLAKKFACLPPLEVIFSKGPASVKKWLRGLDWPSEEPYNDNFPEADTAQGYIEDFMSNHPLYDGDAFAMLGGWMVPFPDGDWRKLVNKTLLALTLKDSEPWNEVWDDGKALKCYARIT